MSETERREVPASAGIVKCPNCGAKVNDNPEKHQHRDKICNNCKMPYKKVGLHLPSFNFDWLRQKLQRKQDVENMKLESYKGRARKILAREHIADEGEVEVRAKAMIEEDKMANKMRQTR